jgi:hypothetical protein
MKNAKEIREITNKKLEEMNASKIKQMKDYIEEVIAPQIEEKASQGKENLGVAIDVTKAYIHEVAKELVANGYEVRQGARYPNIKIYW